MFDNTSRYYYLENAIHTDPSGRKVVYKRRRFLPQGDAIPIQDEAVVGIGERIDMVAARTLGDPQHYWQICDANNAMYPAELTDGQARRLRVPVPQFQPLDPATFASDQGDLPLPDDDMNLPGGN